LTIINQYTHEELLPNGLSDPKTTKPHHILRIIETPGNSQACGSANQQVLPLRVMDMNIK